MSSLAYFVERYSGWRSWATTAGSTANSRWKWAIPSVKELSVSQFFRSPMWWPTHARPPFATAKVFLSSAPHASSGAAAATGSASSPGT